MPFSHNKTFTLMKGPFNRSPLIKGPFIEQSEETATPIPPPPADSFLLLDYTPFLLLDGTDFLLLGD